jgi:hypothetical protein
MIAMAFKCNEFIDTYGVIAMLPFSCSSYVFVFIRV